MIFGNNCPINEQTADGKAVGRCWFHCPEGICPRHGDVNRYLKRLPKLTLENEMRKDKGLTMLGEERGIYTVFTCILLVALFFIIGLALDSGLLELNKTRLQRASDAGAIVGASMIGDIDSDAIESLASKVAEDNLNIYNLSTEGISVEIKDHTEVLVGTKDVSETFFIGRVVNGNYSWPLETSAVAKKQPIAVTLVLDISGSMKKKDCDIFPDVSLPDMNGDVGLTGRSSKKDEASSGDDCEPVTSVIFTNEGLSVHTTSSKDLSNVQLKFCDGLEEKFDGLNGQYGTFSGTEENYGKIIVGAWVKSGCNSSGEGQGKGEYHENPNDFVCQGVFDEYTPTIEEAGCNLPSKLEQLKASSKKIINHFDESLDALSIVSFSDNVTINYPLNKNFSKEDLSSVVDSLEARGWTNTHSAVFVARKQFEKFSSYGKNKAFKNVIILISDGAPNKNGFHDGLTIGGLNEETSSIDFSLGEYPNFECPVDGDNSNMNREDMISLILESDNVRLNGVSIYTVGVGDKDTKYYDAFQTQPTNKGSGIYLLKDLMLRRLSNDSLSNDDSFYPDSCFEDTPTGEGEYLEIYDQLTDKLPNSINLILTK